MTPVRRSHRHPSTPLSFPTTSSPPPPPPPPTPPKPRLKPLPFVTALTILLVIGAATLIVSPRLKLKPETPPPTPPTASTQEAATAPEIFQTSRGCCCCYIPDPFGTPGYHCSSYTCGEPGECCGPGGDGDGGGGTPFAELGLGGVFCQDPGSTSTIPIPDTTVRISGVCNSNGLISTCNGQYYQVEGKTGSDGVFRINSFSWPQDPRTALQQGWFKPSFQVVSLPNQLPSQITNPSFRDQIPLATNCGTGADVCHDPQNVCSANTDFYQSCNLSGLDASAYQLAGKFIFKYTNCTPPPALQCTGLTRSPSSPQIGSTVTLTCQGQADTTPNKIEFRVSTNNGSTWQNLGPSSQIENLSKNTYRGTLDYQVTQSGKYTAECRLCINTRCTTWGEAYIQ